MSQAFDRFHIVRCCATAFALMAVSGVAESKDAYHKRILYSFTGGNDGGGPWAGLIADAQGTFYGTTLYGGNHLSGTFFKMAPEGSETMLYSFCDQANCTDGAFPEAGLIADGAGNFYGTTARGGYDGGDCDGMGDDVGCGTVFKVTPKGRETVLYAFQGGTDGSDPQSSLVVDALGNLYGTTVSGGDDCCGTVFGVTPEGRETVLHSFHGGTDGAAPSSGLVVDANGNLYGTTVGGGFGGGCNQNGVNYGCGTVFKVTPNGEETVLYVFQGGSDGIGPVGRLIADSKGNLYGTTSAGGGGNGDGCVQNGCGTVFRVAADGRETVLYAFQGGSDGANPVGTLTADAKGNLYGTTMHGGSGGVNCMVNRVNIGCGTVFEITNK